MKNLLLLLLICSSAFAQDRHKIGMAIQNLQNANTSFVFHEIFTDAKAAPPSYDETVSNATIATLDPLNASIITGSADEYISVTIPYKNSELSLLLFKVNVTTADFNVDTDKASDISFERGVHYRGIISGDYTSVVSMNFFKGELNGIISSHEYGNIIVGRLTSKGNTTEYIVYAEKDLNAVSGFSCAAPDTKASQQFAPEMERMSVMSNRCVTVYFETDYDLYVANNSDTGQTLMWMISVFNNVQTLFANENISTALKSVFIWTTPDPYWGEYSYDYLDQFNQLRPTFNGDVGMLVGIDAGLGGVAAVVDGLCSENNYSYSDVYYEYNTVPVFSWTVQVITHELGHLYGAPHTHACTWNGNNTAIDGCATTYNIIYAEGSCLIGDIPDPLIGGTIMSYCHLLGDIGINFANGFGTQVANRVFNNVESSICLSTDCLNTCINMVENIVVTNVTTNTALISWTDTSEAASWEICVVPYPFSPANWTMVEDNQYQVANLDPNTYYKFYIRPICSNIAPLSTSAIFATHDDFCSGSLFTDTGGANNNYGNSETWTRTIMPTNSNNKIKVVFNSINIEYGYDFLYVFDGPDTASPEISGGGITGTAPAGPFESTHESGALTFHFVSDMYLTTAGWNATISCTSLGLDENEYTDFSYYPNPANSVVNITSPNEILGVSIYGLDGKLLYDSHAAMFDTQIDISKFSKGTYLFKLQFERSSATFKVIRK